jgi:hypothetical protein
MMKSLSMARPGVVILAGRCAGWTRITSNTAGVDIESDKEGCKFVETTNRGFRSVPTIVFPDGSILVEPSTLKLAQKFGILA